MNTFLLLVSLFRPFPARKKLWNSKSYLANGLRKSLRNIPATSDISILAQMHFSDEVVRRSLRCWAQHILDGATRPCQCTTACATHYHKGRRELAPLQTPTPEFKARQVSGLVCTGSGPEDSDWAQAAATCGCVSQSLGLPSLYNVIGRVYEAEISLDFSNED